MAGGVGGSVVWNLTADPSDFNRGVDQAAAKAKDFGNSVNNIKFGSMAGQASQAFGQVADSIGNVLKGLAVMAVASSFGFGAMTKAAFAQVKQVEEATFALKAYEKNGKKVNAVLNDLVKYARSDLGVLFQRQDLFDAASTLKLYGVETNKLVGYTKILSKGVAVGKTNFQELSEVLGRVVAEGKLTGDAFDILVRRGIKLPDSMRNAAVSAEELFKALDKSLPDEILEGRANTIEGVMVRLQSAFRDLGGAILGVDKNTSKFIKGGLGDQFIQTLKNLRVILRSPEMVTAFEDIGKSIGDLTSNVLPKLITGFKWIIVNYKTVAAGIGSIATAFAGAKVGQGITGLISILAGGLNPITLIVAAIVAAIAALTFLEIKFGFVSKAIAAVKTRIQPTIDLIKNIYSYITTGQGLTAGSGLAFVIDVIVGSITKLVGWLTTLWNFFKVYILPVLKEVWNFIGTQLVSAFNDLKAAFASTIETLKPFLPQLKLIGAITLALVVAPLVILIGVIIGVITWIGLLIAGIARLIGWFAKLSAWLLDLYTKLVGLVVGAFNRVVAIVASVIAWFQRLASQVRSSISQFQSAINSGVNNAINYFRALPGRILGALGALPGILFNIGAQMISGLLSGISSRINGVISTIRGMASSVASAFASVLDIRSPSKVFMGFGSNIVDGLTKGINDGQKLLKNTSLNMAANVTGPSAMTSKDTSLESGSGIYIKNEIGSITLANDVDADRFIQKLTQQDDIISRGLTPQRYSYGQ